MDVKKHCLICDSLIFTGFICSDCQNEISRTRTLDDLSLDEWLYSHPRITRSRSSYFAKPLDVFWDRQ